jgi:hypothetical protein
VNEGPTAVWNSQVTANDDGTFSEQGNISFTTTSIVHFQSALPGHAHDGPDSGDAYGTITYIVTGGEGAFAGAQGWMVDMFIAANGSPAFDINAALVLWVSDDGETQEDLPLQLPQGKGRSSSVSVSDEKKRTMMKKKKKKNQKAFPTKPTTLTTTVSGSFTRVEFALLFEAHPVNGYNHGVASSQVLTSSLSGNDESPLSFMQQNITLLPESSSVSLHWLSHSTSYDNGTFSNVGNLTLSDDTSGHVLAQLLFENDGLGSFAYGPNMSDGSNYGGIGYQILSGSGLWEGAFGGFADMFIGTGDNVYFPISALGVFWIPI